MLKVVKWLVIVVAALLAVLAAVGFFLPSAYHVERSILIEAGPDRVHTLVGDLERWSDWGPWNDIDPSVKTVLGETTAGVGAHQTWSGKSGNGELTFTACDPRTGVAYDIFFNDGSDAAKGSVLYEVEADGTRVTWSMSGDFGMNLPGRYFGLLLNSMLGEIYEKGLSRLKERAEALEASAAPADE
jgi:hypothetical protein